MCPFWCEIRRAIVFGKRWPCKFGSKILLPNILFDVKIFSLRIRSNQTMLAYIKPFVLVIKRLGKTGQHFTNVHLILGRFG